MSNINSLLDQKLKELDADLAKYDSSDSQSSGSTSHSSEPSSTAQPQNPLGFTPIDQFKGEIVPHEELEVPQQPKPSNTDQPQEFDEIPIEEYTGKLVPYEEVAPMILKEKITKNSSTILLSFVTRKEVYLPSMLLITLILAWIFRKIGLLIVGIIDDVGWKETHFKKLILFLVNLGTGAVVIVGIICLFILADIS